MSIRKIDWNEYEDLVRQLSLEIIASLVSYDYLYGIPRGGLVPATMLSHLLNIPVITHIEYDVLTDNRILIVDDIIDSGKTIQRFSDVFDTAAVTVKKNIPEKRRPTYWCWDGLVEVDKWIMFPYETETNDPISKEENRQKPCCRWNPYQGV